MSKARINRLTNLVHAQAGKRKAVNSGKRFMDAYLRGAVVCKDGKERAIREWIKTLSPELSEKLLALLPDESNDRGEHILN